MQERLLQPSRFWLDQSGPCSTPWRRRRLTLGGRNVDRISTGGALDRYKVAVALIACELGVAAKKANAGFAAVALSFKLVILRQMAATDDFDCH